MLCPKHEISDRPAVTVRYGAAHGDLLVQFVLCGLQFGFGIFQFLFLLRDLLGLAFGLCFFQIDLALGDLVFLLLDVGFALAAQAVVGAIAFQLFLRDLQFGFLGLVAAGVRLVELRLHVLFLGCAAGKRRVGGIA